MDPRDELKAVIAKYAHVEGEGSLDNMAFFFSLTQRWFTMAESKRLINKALELGLLEEHGENLRATFDVNNLDLPAVFNPSKNLPKVIADIAPAAKSDEDDLLMKIVSRIRDVTGRDVKSTMGDINREQKKTGFVIEVAALMVAKYHKAEVNDLISEVEALLSSPTQD